MALIENMKEKKCEIFVDMLVQTCEGFMRPWIQRCEWLWTCGFNICDLQCSLKRLK